MRFATLALAAALAAGAALAQDKGTTTVENRTVRDTYTAEAAIDAVRRAAVSAQIFGAVATLYVDAGDRVQRGPLLARTDPRETDAQVAAGTANVAQACDMGIAYGLGLILIYLLVVTQFRSYLTPPIIMVPIPLTIIGALPGHAPFGSQFTATSMIGTIALAGIIVRNSILLVDFIHQRLGEGADLQQATIDAAATRAKPIVPTALAAMLGALFILDDPIFNGLAISLLFGIFVSTLPTLVAIPVLYYSARYARR